jgi:N-alpha-acetyltransferase 15/16, NatA auxiliary subunit
MKLLFWEDRLRSHPFYARAAKNAISIYIRLYDNPHLANEPPEVDGLNDPERKKAAKKAKKAAKKQEEQSTTANESKDAKKDDDPRGEALVKTEKPLEEAVKFLKPLQELSPTLLETQLLAFDVHFRRGLITLPLWMLICRQVSSSGRCIECSV